MNLKTMSWLCGLLGFALLVLGLALWSLPLALVVAGLALLAYAALLDMAATAAARQSLPPPTKPQEG